MPTLLLSDYSFSNSVTILVFLLERVVCLLDKALSFNNVFNSTLGVGTGILCRYDRGRLLTITCPMLSNDIIEGNFDIGYLQSSTLISIRREEDLTKIWTSLNNSTNNIVGMMV